MYIAGGVIKWYSYSGKEPQFLKKLNHTLATHPSGGTLERLSQINEKSHPQKNLQIIVLAAPFVIAPEWNNPSVPEWMNGPVDSDTPHVEWTVVHTAAWVGLKAMTWSRKANTKVHRLYDPRTHCSWKNKITGMEDRLAVARG